MTAQLRFSGRARGQGHVDIVRLLFEINSGKGRTANDGTTAMPLTILRGHLDLAAVLNCSSALFVR